MSTNQAPSATTPSPGSVMVRRADLQVAATLADFVEREVLDGLGITAEAFWKGLSTLAGDFADRNRELLATREAMQSTIDAWHRDHPSIDPAAYRRMLEEIGYVRREPEPFRIDTSNTDVEIATLAGPQLVVPVSNARYALNAANARWGSLYDALYGTDALGDRPTGSAYDPVRGRRVVAWVKDFLDQVMPLAGASHASVGGYRVSDGALVAVVEGREVALSDPAAFVGHTGAAENPSSVMLVHHGLHVELVFDRSTVVGGADPAGITDVVIESAVSTIVDLEDSVAAVDADDKVAAYRNWLGLMRGDLTATFERAGRSVKRALEPDRELTGADGSTIRRRGRALLLVRNVGNLMTTPAVLDAHGRELYEGLLDALVTVAIAQHDLGKPAVERNSPAGSVYIVKPKLHGPDEVAFVDAVFSTVEDVLGLPRHTVKLGIMDEERRTTVNLAACISAARSRVAFVNTGFLDRTGDEIHTSMEAGPMVRKAEMKSQTWITAYEANNVAVGLRCGLLGRAQIGKGMWAAPDLMGGLLAEKIAHPQAGASCAWVPSPTAATLHAIHYHRVDVPARQRELAGVPAPPIDDLLVIPLAAAPAWTADELRNEVDNNAQGILGYVVRWVDRGVGCSKVPDINDVALMEDRATCRISSQHVANWLRHGVVDAAFVEDSLRRMAAVVDRQNAGDPAYAPMAPDFNGHAFLAAHDLIFAGTTQPSGYTEPILHMQRLALKAEARS
jgi:malate synthase